MDYKVINYWIQKFRTLKTKSRPLDIEETRNTSEGKQEGPNEMSDFASNESIGRLAVESINDVKKIGGVDAFRDEDTAVSLDDVKTCGNADENQIKINETASLERGEVTSKEHYLVYQMTRLMNRLDHLEIRLLRIDRIQTLPDMIRQVHVAFESHSVDIGWVRSIMESYVSKFDDWKRYAKFNKDRYTRNLVDEGNGKFNLILLCWSKGQISSVHDHSQAHCLMKMLQGSLTEVRYQEPKVTLSPGGRETDQPLTETGRTELRENDVCYINDSIGLHKVGNMGPHEGSVSLHLYSPPFNMCSSFDPRTGRKSLVKMTFWSKFGEELDLEL